jgi:translation initiation factor 1
MGKKIAKGKGWELIRPDAPDVEPEPEFPPRDRQRPKVSLEKRRMGKVVTVVSGLLLPPEELKALVKAMKAACGTGGTSTDDGLELQGDKRDAVREFLKSKGFR